VYDVLSWLAEGMSTTNIISDFPELNEDQIKLAWLTMDSSLNPYLPFPQEGIALAPAFKVFTSVKHPSL
jgi:hypothetical protein